MKHHKGHYRGHYKEHYRAKSRTVWCAAALGLAGLCVLAGAVFAVDAEELPSFDNQGKKVFEALQDTPSANLQAGSRGRNLNQYYDNRQYPGSPPRIPHDVDPAFKGDETDCLSCHEQGGYSPEHQKFAPITPHPENTLCYQCHTRVSTRESFVANGWKSIEPPKLGRSALGGSPPPVPHTLQLRENCVACHTGPGAVIEIRVSHAERGDCRQCHATMVQTAPPKRFSREAGDADMP